MATTSTKLYRNINTKTNIEELCDDGNKSCPKFKTLKFQHFSSYFFGILSMADIQICWKFGEPKT
jgi:hypothetical protein